MNRKTKRLVALISGNGLTLQSVIDATRWQTLGAEVVAVFSHEAWSYGLLRAEREGVPAILHDLTEFRVEGKSEYEYNEALADKIAAYKPDLVVLADWKQPLTDNFFQRFPHKILNLQPGLPGESPLFGNPYARNPVSRAYEAYNAGLINQTHLTTQILNNAFGSGRVIAQVPVPIYDFDSLIDLEERMNRAQQELLINTLSLLLRDYEEEEEEPQEHYSPSPIGDLLVGEIWRFG